MRGQGSHTVEYRARDRAGNQTDPVGSVTFTINLNTGGTSCLPQSDEFSGSALDAKWTVLRSAGGGPTVSNGHVNLPILQGDFIANDALASNTVLTDAPNGEWTATAKLETSGLNANGEQAGIVLWKSEQPNTFAKLVAIQSSNGTHQFEFIVTQNGAVNPPIGSSITPAPGGQLPAYVLLRARNNGTNIIGEFSTDDGASWTRVGTATHAAPITGALKVGPVAFRGSNGGGTASFDYLRVHSGSAEDTPVNCTAGCSPQSDQFTGSELHPKWEILNPSSGNAPSVSGGHLTLPVIQGDLYGGTATAQVLYQDAPTGSWVATAKIAHENINRNGEAAGLALINSTNPNHFLKTALQYKSDVDPETAGDQPGKWAERVLTANGEAVTLPPATVPWPNSGGLSTAGDYVWVRFVHDATAGTITTWTSTEGSTFTSFGAPISVSQYLSQPGGLKLGLFAKHDGGENDTVQLDAFNVVPGTADPQTAGDNCGGVTACVQNDEFDGAALDPKWEIRNSTPANVAVAGGKLSLTTAQGDVSGANFTARNIALQDVPTGPWSVTTKLDHTAINQNGVAGGLVIYGSDNPNYFAKIGVQYKTNDLGGNPMNGIWAERVLTSNGSINAGYGGNYPNTGKLTPQTADLWLRATYDGTNLVTEYSYDGTTFASIAQAVPVNASTFGAGGITKVGLFVKHDGGNTARPISFDSFKVAADSCGGGGDSSPARTTHTLNPASPDGTNGYYKSNVTVTLNATDNQGGTGVDYIEYRNQGTTAWTRYSDPIVVETAGRSTIEYRSVDKAGNTEATRTVTFQIDKAAPTTTAKLNGEAPKANYDGPVQVDLDATDGTGSGVAKTEVRVDGGEWKPYEETETILNSAADLAKWAQAGAGGLNWVDDPNGGYARTFGNFGMPWYPVKDYGDFSLKMQWRDSSTGTSGNGGVFVRFPNPTEAVTRPAGQRHACQVGSAQSDPAWVAIYCGHEIQINDNQPSEPQKTGSVYNFQPLNTTQAKVQPRGTWVDYEIRVVGQTYTIIRNGEVLQTFENTRDKPSSRQGDPSTTDRQFARGYIGLQNHGTSDVIDYRNIRVEPLGQDVAKGPITVSGDGAHKVEFRSTDNAGNVETTKSVDFTIGDEPSGDDTAPNTTAALNPAQPGPGGTYTGPVGVTLSATDPAETGTGGGPAATHTVKAMPAVFDPAAVSAKVGDTVRFTWNEGGTTHDLWKLNPGDAPNADGTSLLPPPGYAFPTTPPTDVVVDQVGTYTFVCKVHGHREEGEWKGMVTKVTVSENSSSVPGSGVDYTEYRVNNGAWVKNTNTGTASPFVTTFQAQAEGAYSIEYRSADKAGNVEATKTVAFTIDEPSGGDSVDEDVDVIGTVPRVLGITIEGALNFGAITPGLDQVYTAGATVKATSSVRSSKLTISDPTSTAKGHLVNGSSVMPQALQVQDNAGAFVPLTSTVELDAWGHPLANESVPLNLKQPVSAGDRLLEGNYTKRVTLTLSATTP
ncbi:DUF1080 domain-containing protein [Solirubrobacter sp. CPCC 204708]|uniref:DUF1080 domain-containing protein n=1 Tax=Solirubrobacter deserti TaxID=2282478 RepID=A0ABT4RPD5_9ACTN|nr:DUF1080 domain-containing protein [Solirubrobacter deserti]